MEQDSPNLKRPYHEYLETHMIVFERNFECHKPNQQNIKNYLMAIDDETYKGYKNGRHEDGFWILYFKWEKIDQMWNKACRLYFGNYLRGVSHISVLNRSYKEDPNSKPGYSHIHFFCGPSGNKLQMAKVGHRVAIFMEYFCDTGIVNYQAERAFYFRNKYDQLPMNYKISTPITEVASYEKQEDLVKRLILTNDAIDDCWLNTQEIAEYK